MRRALRLLLGLTLLATPATLRAQLAAQSADTLAVAMDSADERGLVRSIASKIAAPVRFVRSFRSGSDRAGHAEARAVAERANGDGVGVDSGDHRFDVI